MNFVCRLVLPMFADIFSTHLCVWIFFFSPISALTKFLVIYLDTSFEVQCSVYLWVCWPQLCVISSYKTYRNSLTSLQYLISFQLINISSFCFCLHLLTSAVDYYCLMLIWLHISCHLCVLLCLFIISHGNPHYKVGHLWWI